MSTNTAPTIGQKVTETVKRLAMGLVILIGLFATLRFVIGDMAAAAVALVVMSLVVNVYFADPEPND